MPLLEDYLGDVSDGFVIVPDTLHDKIHAALTAEFVKWPDAEKDREVLYQQLIAFFHRHGYLPEFSLEPRGS
jgi:hypothetical protein